MERLIMILLFFGDLFSYLMSYKFRVLYLFLSFVSDNNVKGINLRIYRSNRMSMY